MLEMPHIVVEKGSRPIFWEGGVDSGNAANSC